MQLDDLKLALLAALAEEQTLLHRIHGELEHWLNRPLDSGEIDAALAELESQRLVVCRDAGAAAYLTTAEGRTLVAARWQDFFPE